MVLSGNAVTEDYDLIYYTLIRSYRLRFRRATVSVVLINNERYWEIIEEIRRLIQTHGFVP